MAPVYEADAVSGYRLELYKGKTYLGLIAGLSNGQQDAYDLRDPLFFAELNWDAMLPHLMPGFSVAYREFSRFPVVERDIAVLVDKTQQVGDMVAAMEKAGGKLLKQVRVFDLYEGKQVGEGKKSIAFGMRFGANKTLKDAEVDKSVRAMGKALENGFGAELRQ